MGLRRTRRRTSKVVATVRSAREGFRKVSRGAIGGIRAAGVSVLSAADQLPDATKDARMGAQDASRALQRLPSSTLQWLAASSVGLGTGLFVSGAPRAVIAASMAPALVIGAAIVARSADPREIGQAGRRPALR